MLRPHQWIKLPKIPDLGVPNTNWGRQDDTKNKLVNSLVCYKNRLRFLKSIWRLGVAGGGVEILSRGQRRFLEKGTLRKVWVSLRQWFSVGDLTSQGAFGNFWRRFCYYRCPNILGWGMLRNLVGRGRVWWQMSYRHKTVPNKELPGPKHQWCYCQVNPTVRVQMFKHLYSHNHPVK